jgi:hypothetical protein
MGQLMWGRVLPGDSTENAVEVRVLQSWMGVSYRKMSEGGTGRCS